jgi:ParB-like chromosome segregation protein Spo0J
VGEAYCPDALAELADSMHGQLQPIAVGPASAGYEVIAGHRRLDPAKVLGWVQISAVVGDELTPPCPRPATKILR